MLKHRLIPCILLKNELVIQSIEFERFLPIGKASVAIEFFVNWDVDEIVLLDIDATREGRSPNLDLITLYARECFVPLTVGGGISTIDDIRAVLRAGADKVSLNAAAINTPELITQASKAFGDQCVTISIDAKLAEDGSYQVYTNGQSTKTGYTAVEWAKKVQALGAGEILLNSIDRDGTKKGYDTDLIRQVADAVSIPVIACGGVGQMPHLVEGITKGGAQAVAAANIFQYTEHSTIVAKSFLQRSGVDVRLSSPVKYTDLNIDNMGRILP